MSARGVLRVIEGGMVGFHCPGCEEMHVIFVRRDDANPGPVWTFNDDYDRPTFQPSILVNGRRMTKAGRAAWKAWCDAGCPTPAPEFESEHLTCHSFVTSGAIQFLGDCTHALAGQTVPLEAQTDD